MTRALTRGLTRRELFALIGMTAAAGCRDTKAPAERRPQPTTALTVTLTVDGMV